MSSKNGKPKKETRDTSYDKYKDSKGPGTQEGRAKIVSLFGQKVSGKDDKNIETTGIVVGYDYRPRPGSADGDYAVVREEGYGQMTKFIPVQNLRVA